MNDTNHYCKDGHFLYLRVNGIYYRCVKGKGWEFFPAENLPTHLHWAPLSLGRLAAFAPRLPHYKHSYL